jgi:hypothetical protein
LLRNSYNLHSIRKGRAHDTSGGFPCSALLRLCPSLTRMNTLFFWWPQERTTFTGSSWDEPSRACRRLLPRTRHRDFECSRQDTSLFIYVAFSSKRLRAKDRERECVIAQRVYVDKNANSVRSSRVRRLTTIASLIRQNHHPCIHTSKRCLPFCPPLSA